MGQKAYATPPKKAKKDEEVSKQQTNTTYWAHHYSDWVAGLRELYKLYVKVCLNPIVFLFFILPSSSIITLPTTYLPSRSHPTHEGLKLILGNATGVSNAGGFNTFRIGSWSLTQNSRVWSRLLVGDFWQTILYLVKSPTPAPPITYSSIHTLIYF